ncbi:MAG: hypothetical protein ACYC91_14080 [Solirubrobacteraceae bacterium]
MWTHAWRGRAARPGQAFAAPLLALILVGQSPIQAAVRRNPGPYTASRSVRITNPPRLAGSGFTVRVRGTRGPVALYLSLTREPTGGAIWLGRVTPVHGELKIRPGAATAPGGYYVIACSGRGRLRVCGASQTPTVVLSQVPAALPSALNGSVSLAPARAHSAMVGPTGGSVRASGPDGTRYILAVAPGSVASGTRITLTPLTRLFAPRLGRLAGGVSIAPAGLPLLRGGALVIRPARSVSTGARTAVTFEGPGRDIRTVPLAPGAVPITMPVGVLGGYAVLGGGSHPFGGDRLSGFYAQMLAALAQGLARSGSQLGDGSDQTRGYVAAAGATLDAWYAEIQTSEIPPGRLDDASAATAIGDLATWGTTGSRTLGDGQPALAGVPLAPTAASGLPARYGANWLQTRLLAPFQRLIGGIYDRAQEQCASEHDLTLLPKIASAYSSDLLAGHRDTVPLDGRLACEHFTLAFDSTILTTFSAPSSGSWTTEYVATVNLSPDPTGTLLTGGATGAYARASGTQVTTTPCDGALATSTTSEQGGTGAPFIVTDLTLAGSAGGAAGYPLLTFAPGQPSESYVSTVSPPCGGTTTSQRSLWASLFGIAHAPQFGRGEYVMALKPGAGATLGSVVFAGTPNGPSGEAVNEQDALTVTHTPQPFQDL